jgi:hypothetical protein
MVETKLVAVRAARHRLAAEVEQLRVAGLYQQDLSPSAGDRLPLRRPGRPARCRAGAWASKGLGLPAGKVARLLGQLGVTITRVGDPGAGADGARLQRTYAALVCGTGQPGRRHE